MHIFDKSVLEESCPQKPKSVPPTNKTQWQTNRIKILFLYNGVLLSQNYHTIFEVYSLRSFDLHSHSLSEAAVPWIQSSPFAWRVLLKVWVIVLLFFLHARNPQLCSLFPILHFEFLMLSYLCDATEYVFCLSRCFFLS